jgi:hypothetical protein
MLVRGDDHYMAICNKTGTIAIYNESQNLFLSPLVDGPIKYTGTLADNLKIQTISKFGRSFSIVRVPYAFKLLMQELITMNVQMRLITEANVDQMTNMSFSNNIEKLTGKKTFGDMGTGTGMATAKGPVLTRQDKQQLAALGFKKLPPPPFKKWRISKIDTILVSDLAPLPTAENRDFVTLEPAQENQWFKLNDEINAAKNKLDDIPPAIYSNLAGTLDMYARLRNVVQRNYNMEHATNAALKMYEMIQQLELLSTGDGKCLPAVNVFCNAELPGAFIIAINHYMKTKCVSSEFDWIASSYLPEAALQAGNATILEDRYKIYEKNRYHWLMGPAPNGLPEGEAPITGDVTEPSVINTLGNTTHQRFAANDGADLYTSDVGIEIAQAEMNRQEELTAFVNLGQVLTGLLSLAIGGSLVTKQFTFVTPFSRSLIAIVAGLFEETYVTKPKTSRPTNSEIYLVGKGFKGISTELATALLERCDAYKTLDKLPTTWGSLLKPEVLARADTDILAAAQGVHGEQQVAFLNEIADAYRMFNNLAELKPLVNKYELQAQKTWLDENPLSAISKDENLNNTVVGIEEEKAQEAQRQAPRQTFGNEPQQQAQQQAQQQGLEQPLEEVSILVPEEEKKENEEEEKEEEKGESKKKTINFNL